MLQQWWAEYQPEQYPWMGEVIIAVLVVLSANLLLSAFLRRLAVRFARTHNLWDDSLLEASRRPLILMLWAVGASYVLEVVGNSTDAEIFPLLSSARAMGVVLILAWFLVSLVRQVERRLLSDEYRNADEPVDQTTVMALGKLVRSTVIIVASLMVLQNLGYSISGVLAFGGIGGIAVGFAAKDLLSNFFGGLMIYLDRPFSVGEWIRSPDKDIEGTVENIGWRLTRIRTFDSRPLYVPNATFAQIAVENPSRMLNRRIYETIGVRYQDADLMPEIIRRVKAMLEDHPDIDLGRTLIVNFNKYNASSLDFFIYTFTKTRDWVEYHAVKQDVLLQVMAIIHELGADVAYPTTTLKIDPIAFANQSESAIEGRQTHGA
ncbi:mechanosensitive ion channel family protein [Spongiibacter taiwanensis]|uniref:mechanosensitive ion channel family protein n=1 Tax=Spongiibacter taiwanensis TaxID=1748242 RepID=UPI0020350BEC|nr:mechanosensitive ion channel family protein [Spongiibacter taiwanensis]USA43535.1 mechanosensitive ion channel family protein [Spongiibacter taiwanensis]